MNRAVQHALLVMGFLSSILVACASPAAQAVDQMDTHAAPATPSLPPCAPVTPIAVQPQYEPYTPHAIYFVPDNTTSHAIYFTSTLELIGQTVEHSLMPGDRVAVAMLGAGFADPVVAAHDVPVIIEPGIPSLPTLAPPAPSVSLPWESTPTPLPLELEDMDLPRRHHEKVAALVAATNTAIAATATVDASNLDAYYMNDYYCRVREYSKRAEDAAAQREKAQEEARRAVVEEVQHQLALVPASPENETNIYGALLAATDFFAVAKKDHYERNVLVLLSDMNHTSLTNAGSEVARQIRLDGVTVVVAMMPFAVDGSAPSELEEYHERREWWETWLKEHGAEELHFLTMQNTSVQSVIKATGR